MRQVLYISSRSPHLDVSIANVLMTSRVNNDQAGVTGLLYTDGNRFLQVLEGERADVDATVARIKSHPRHQAIVILSDRETTEREFGGWAMAHRLPTDSADTLDAKLERLLSNASPTIRGTFTGLVAARQSNSST